MLSLHQKLKLLGFASGILVCYTTFGVLQEKIFRGRYGDDVAADGKPGEIFKLPIAFGAMQCIFYTTFAKGLLVFLRVNLM